MYQSPAKNNINPINQVLPPIYVLITVII